MSKADDLLAFCKKNVGSWCCAFCGSNSSQPAAIFRELKNAGWDFEEWKEQRWAKKEYCHKCKTERTHYKLLSLKQGVGNLRKGLTPTQRERILSVLGKTDAFSDTTAASSVEVDHKEPFRRLREKGLSDFNPDEMSDKEIRDHYQVLTRDHNLLKDRKCEQCQRSGSRPPFMGIKYWYKGNEKYEGTCCGCGYYDGVEWRRSLNSFLKK